MSDISFLLNDEENMPDPLAVIPAVEAFRQIVREHSQNSKLRRDNLVR
jgi:hypothetical protein